MSDPLDVLERYAYSIALPPPSLYAQFNNLDDPDMVLAGLFLSLLRRPWSHAEGVFDPAAWCAFFTIVLVGSVLCFGLYFLGVGRIGPARGSILGATEPLTSTVLSVFWLHVAFLPMDYVGFALIVSTIFLLALPHGKGHGEEPAAT